MVLCLCPEHVLAPAYPVYMYGAKEKKDSGNRWVGSPPVSRLTSRARACVQETLGLLASQL